jgi:hypothetical protein
MKTARKSKMISFRLEPDEYTHFLGACESMGLPSVSELARTAIYRLDVSGRRPTVEQLSDQILELHRQLTALTGEINKLVRQIDNT